MTGLTDPQLAALGVFALAVVLLLTEKYHRVVSAMVAAGLMVYFGSFVYGLFRPEDAFGFVDMVTLRFVVGVLILVEGLYESGLFQFAGLWLVRVLGGRREVLFVAFMFLSLAVTLFLANLPAMLVVGAMTASLAGPLGLNLRKWVVYEAAVCNGGAVGLMISSVPNLIVALRFGMDFGQFLTVGGPLAVLLTAATAAVGVASGDLYSGPPRVDVREIDPWGAAESAGIMVRAAAIFAGFVAVVVAQPPGLPMDAAALLAAALMLWACGGDPERIFSRVDWSTVFFLASFYVVVGGLEESGALEVLARAAGPVWSAGGAALTSAVLWASGLTSGLVDNVPVALTFASLIESASPLAAPDVRAAAWAVAAGANVGGSLTYFASPPSLVAVGILEREVPGFSPMDFTREGGKLTLLQLTLSDVYLVLLRLSGAL